MIWLDKNENLDPILIELANKVICDLPDLTVATYPEAGKCYRMLADWNHVQPESLLLTPGSDGAIRLVFEAFVNPGDPVVITDPTFAMYPVYSRMFGARQIPIEYSRQNGEPFLDPDRFLRAISEHQPKLACLPNPDSPTGTVMAPGDLREILSACEKFGTIFLVDEAYHPFYEDSVISWTENTQHLVVARTFAKAWSLAGLRIGYATANPETIALIHKMRPMYEVSTLSVEMVSRMLDHAGEMENSVARMHKAKEEFAGDMESLGFRVLRTHGNFIHVAFTEQGTYIHEYLADKVYYRKAFSQPCLQGYARFSIGSAEAMKKVSKFIKQAVKENNQ